MIRPSSAKSLSPQCLDKCMKSFFEHLLMNTIAILTMVFACQGSVLHSQTIVSSSEADFLEQNKQLALQSLMDRDEKRQNERAIDRMLTLLERSPGAFELLELQDYQKKELEELRTEYAVALEKLKENSRPNGEYRNTAKEKTRLRQQLNRDIHAVLLPHQQELIASFNVKVAGLPRALTETSVGEVLKLTEAQKIGIRESSDKLAKKIHDFIHEARQDSMNVIYDELTDEQIDKLGKIYGENSIKHHFESSRFEQLFIDHLLNKECIPNIEKFQMPHESLMTTRLNKSQSQKR